MLELIEIGMKWRWEDIHQKTFEEVKVLFIENIMLHYPQKEEQFIVYANASDYAVESILHQKNADRKLRVTAYASLVFKGAERHYCTSKKELLSIVNALKQFRSTFMVHTDHRALSFQLK